MSEKIIHAELDAYALCTNPECGATFEISEIGPIFCSRCKYPLFTNCLSCGTPFLYRPEKFCGFCSGNLAFDSSARGWLMLCVYKRLRKSGLTPESELEILLNRSSALSEYEKFFPCLSLQGDIRAIFEERGLDILLSPPTGTRKTLLRLVGKAPS